MASVLQWTTFVILFGLIGIHDVHVEDVRQQESVEDQKLTLKGVKIEHVDNIKQEEDLQTETDQPAVVTLYVQDDDVTADVSPSAAEFDVSNNDTTVDSLTVNEHSDLAENISNVVEVDNSTVSTSPSSEPAASADDGPSSSPTIVINSEQPDDQPPDSSKSPDQVKSVDISDKGSADDFDTTPQLAGTNKDDMPSFDEWKQKEQEKTKNIEELPVISASASLKTKLNKKRVNFASVTCGAKIIAANSEAQNAGFVLIENKDQYMINPCKAKKFFTVELCESVQIQMLEIGNLELFSSLPHSFDVLVSDRYPSKEWKNLGTFHALDDRSIQSFSVEDGLMFAKYLRIEMLSHYGTEHFCPLTVIRVFGVTLDEDDDDHETEQHEPVDDDADSLTASVDNPTNLFSSAKDTVMSLVNTVFNPVTETRDDLPLSGNVSQNSTIDESSSSQVNTSPEPCGSSVQSENVIEFVDDKTLSDLLVVCEVCENDTCLSGLCAYYTAFGLDISQSCLGAWHHPVEKSSPVSSNDDNMEPTGDTQLQQTLSTTNNISAAESNETSYSDEIQSSDGDLSSPTEGTDDDSLSSVHSSAFTDSSEPSSSAAASSSPSTSSSSEPSSSSAASSSPSTSFSSEPSSSSAASSSPSSSSSSSHKDVYAESVSKLELGDYDIDPAAAEDGTFQKLSSRIVKETLYTKLKNRIRTLEANLNLTNRYLEELSKRYKRQMEDMYSSLNRTITKLSNTAKIAEEKDQHQLERIQFLETQVDNLTATVNNIALNIDSINYQLVERHLILMAFELLMFVVVLVYTTTRHNDNKLKQTTETADNCSLMQTQTLPNKSRHHRRMSADVTRRVQHNDAFLKSGSESDLSAIEQNIPIFLMNADRSLPSAACAADVQKRQRKKKKNQGKISGTSSTGKPIANYRVGHGTAGLMFTSHSEPVETIGSSWCTDGAKKNGYHRDGTVLGAHHVLCDDETFFDDLPNGDKEMIFRTRPNLSCLSRRSKSHNIVKSCSNVILKDIDSQGRVSLGW